MAIYMKYGSIKGTVTTEGWKDWVELGSCQMGAGRGVGSSRGTGSNREASEPSVSEIVVTKTWDAISSVALFQESVAGELSNEVQIDFTSTNKDKQQLYLTVKLFNTGVSGYSASSGGDKPSESVSLNFSKIEITPFKVGNDLKATKGEVVNFNLETMKANG